MAEARDTKKIVVALSGASGSIYAKQLLDILVGTPHEIAIVMSTHAQEIWATEVGTDIAHYDRPIYDRHNFQVPFASGSSAWDSIVVIPCSMGMLGRIAHGTSEDLIARAADVALKERKPLFLVPRETPYSAIHLENMLRLTRAGATIFPASPSFYGQPTDIPALVDTVVARIVDHLGIPYDPKTPRWGNP
jgi:flavin prenyltransferase